MWPTTGEDVLAPRYLGYMTGVSFAARSFQVVDGPMGARDLVLGTLVTAADARALADALAWRRNRDHLAAPAEDADAVLALRAIVELVDQLETLTSGDHAGPMTLTKPQVVLLAETSATYVAERGSEEFTPAPEAERLGRLRSLTGPLFDLVGGFAGAEAELRERAPRS